jgi:hypothetical protein
MGNSSRALDGARMPIISDMIEIQVVWNSAYLSTCACCGVGWALADWSLDTGSLRTLTAAEYPLGIGQRKYWRRRIARSSMDTSKSVARFGTQECVAPSRGLPDFLNRSPIRPLRLLASWAL